MSASRAPTQRHRGLWHGSRKLRFLVIGGWNTLFGYLCFLGLYLLAGHRVHYSILVVLAHAIAVSQAYLMQRKLVFHSAAPIGPEFLRFNLSHLGTLVFGLLAMALLVDGVGLSPLVAQALVTAASVVLSYLLHSRVSFSATAMKRPPAP